MRNNVKLIPVPRNYWKDFKDKKAIEEYLKETQDFKKMDEEEKRSQVDGWYEKLKIRNPSFASKQYGSMIKKVTKGDGSNS